MTYQPYLLHGSGRSSRWLITCEHATNVVPPTVNNGDLGLPDSDMTRHIAYDLGAWGVATRLADLLGGVAVGANFSRLVIDPNRGSDDPTLVMKLYDGSIIPANRNADASEAKRRTALFYRPFHDQVAEHAAQHPDTVMVSIHSFTPQLRGRPPRPWQIGILSAADRRLTEPMHALLSEDRGLTVGDNQPYNGHLPGDSIDTHAIKHKRLNALIELRNDLISESEGQMSWAERLAPICAAALERAETEQT